MALWSALMLASPGAAWSQPTPNTTVTVVTLASRPPAAERGAGRFALSISLGTGFGVAGFSADGVRLGLSGVLSLGSLRASVGLGRVVAVQLGAVGGLWFAPWPSVSGSPQRFDLEGVSGFGLLGGGVTFGASGEGPGVSLLGGVAWLRAPVSGVSWTRTGTGPGGGGALEVGYHLSLGRGWTLGVGGIGWILVGSDPVGWVGGASPSWLGAGGGLCATVASR